MKEYFYDCERGVILFVGPELSTFHDRIGSVIGMVEDDELPARASVLIDVSEVLETPTPSQLLQIGKLAQLIHERFGERIAIVNCRVGHQTLSQMATLVANLDYCRAFLSRADAYLWLGV